MAKQRKTKGRFVGIPYNVANSHQFAELSYRAKSLILDLLLQYNGHNNGSLSACHTLMKNRGWPKASLYRTVKELVYAGFIVVTRQGWKQRGRPTLLAITWNGIDEAKIEYDEGIKPSPIPLSYWCKHPNCWRDEQRLTVMDGGLNKKVTSP